MNKKVLITSIALTIGFLFAGKTFAQSSGSATTTLNVKLQDARSISITQKTVDLIFSNLSDFRNGVRVSVPNHLQIISSTGFQIKVSSGEYLNGSSQESNIKANTITVTPSLSGSNTNPPSVTLTAQRLGTTTGLTIANCTAGTLPLSFDVAYSTDPDAYIGKKSETYSATITYEITSL